MLVEFKINRELCHAMYVQMTGLNNISRFKYKILRNRYTLGVIDIIIDSVNHF